MARWDDATVRLVRERTDLVALVGETVRLRRAGRRYVGLCPFHAERTPSFGVAADKGLFHCFGCGAGGDAFEFLMRRDGLAFPEAFEELARRAGVALEGEGDPAEAERRRRRERLLAAVGEAERWYRQAYRTDAGKAARAYVAGRGIEGAVADAFGLGYAPAGSGLHDHLTALGYAPGELEAAGLETGGQARDALGGRLILPIRDGRGRTVGFGARALGDGQPKYLNSPEGPLFAKRFLLYGLDRARAAIRRGGEALVVEGYFDVIACHQAGFEQAVASLGTALGREALALLRHEAARVVFAYDADAAGRKAAGAALALCGALEMPARAARLTGGKDPAEVLQTRGREALARDLEGARGRVPFALDEAVAQGRATTPEGKAEVAREVLSLLVEETSPVARAGYLREVAERLDVPEESLVREMARLERRRPRPQARDDASPHRREKTGNDTPSKRKDARARREEELAAIVLNAPQVGRAIGVDAGRFRDGELARLVATVLAGGPEAVDGELGPRAAALLLGETDVATRYPDPEAAARDMWRRLEADFARAQRTTWQERIADLERRGEQPPDPYVEAVRREVRRSE